MSLPTLTGVGRLTSDPDLRFGQSGVAVCKLSLAFNSKRKDESGNWVDADVFFVKGVLFKTAAENAAESLTKGTEVVVSGRLKTDQWNDKTTGDKRSAPSLLIDEIGPSIRWAQATVRKSERGGQAKPAADDPWVTAAPAAASDSPPF